MTARARWFCLLAVAGLLAAAGCVDHRAQELKRLDASYDQCQAELRELRTENEQLKRKLTDARTRAETLEQLGGPARVEKLYTVARIELGKNTGAANLDDADGDDGVKIYLKPIDRTGSVLKAPGSVRIRLYDLGDGEDAATQPADAPGRGEATPDAPRGPLLGQCEFSVDETAEHWYGGFVTYHYSFDCRWDRPPTGRDVTIRVEFTDYLTGRTFTAQKRADVDLP